MGVVRQMHCKKCDARWEAFEGVGFSGEPSKEQKDLSKACPACGSDDIEKLDIVALWD